MGEACPDAQGAYALEISPAFFDSQDVEKAAQVDCWHCSIHSAFETRMLSSSKKRDVSLFHSGLEAGLC